MKNFSTFVVENNNNYIYTYDDMVLEKLNIKGLMDKFKTKPTKQMAKTIVGVLLTVFTIQQANGFINKQDISNDTKIILKKHISDSIHKDDSVHISKYKDATKTKLSQSGWDHIRKEESLRLKAYKLGDGMITIGYGHAQPVNKSRYKHGQTITMEQANKLLYADVNKAAAGVRRIFKEWKQNNIDVKITQNQYDVLVSMAFNMGISGLRKSNFIQKLKKGDYKGAAELIKVASSGDFDKFPGLEKRRERESKKFLE